MMGNEVIQQALSVGLGVVGGGAMVSWMVKRYIVKIDELIVSVARLEATVKANERMKEDVRDHEKRITILEPKVQRAHERLDEHHISKH